MIQITRLISGEEIVADITQKEGKFVFKNPVRIMMTREGLGMGPISPFAKMEQTKENIIEIREEHVVWATEVDEELANAYNAQFGNGIVVASAGSGLDLSYLKK